jgi:hypothetical protein
MQCRRLPPTVFAACVLTRLLAAGIPAILGSQPPSVWRLLPRLPTYRCPGWGAGASVARTPGDIGDYVSEPAVAALVRADVPRHGPNVASGRWRVVQVRFGVTVSIALTSVRGAIPHAHGAQSVGEFRDDS